MRHPNNVPRRRIRGALAPLLAILLALPANAAAPPDRDGSVRYGHRQGVSIPEGSLVDELALRGGTTFAPEVDSIVTRMDLPTYEGFLKGLSGWTPVLVGGSSTTFATRYSLVTPGQVCWQYVYETLEALGYDVRYHHYSRSGYQLKNIVATITGETTPNEIHVLGAHLDSISQIPSTTAPGAEDNASGTAGVLAAAVALVGERFDSTIELVLFTGEEQGLWGSDAYVDDAIASGKDVQSAVTFDMIAAWNNDYGVLIEGETAWQPLMSLYADAIDTYTSISRQFSYFSFGSDHVSFQDAGIPAILAIDLDWGSYPHYHSTTDTYDRTTPALGLEIARAGVAAVAHQAGPLGQVSDVPGVLVASTLSAYPNPATSTVTVSYLVSAGSRDQAAEAGVYDVRGRRVRSLPAGDAVAIDPDQSLREVRWDLRDSRGRIVRPGVYWVRFGEDSRKVVVAP